MVLYSFDDSGQFSCCWSSVSARLVSMCFLAVTDFDFSCSKMTCFSAMSWATSGGSVGRGDAGVFRMMASFLLVDKVLSFPHMRPL